MHENRVEDAGTAVTAEEGAVLLRRMILIRRFDELALELIQTERIDGVVHPYVGQESCAVGVCSALAPGDRVVSNHRGHGHCIAQGTSVARMMAELFGRADGCCKGKGGSMHIADFEVGMLGANGIVGAGPPMAVGAALSDALDGTGQVTVVFFGDGATGQGLLFESMNLAALWKLPVLFVCENNGIASGTPLHMTIPTPHVADLASGHGLRSVVTNGDDVLEVQRAAREAVDQLRKGDGPMLLECILDRWGPHASRFLPLPDLRDPGDLEEARLRDPIARLRLSLEQTGALALEDFDRLVTEVDHELQEALSFAESSPLPDLVDAMEDVFA